MPKHPTQMAHIAFHDFFARGLDLGLGALDLEKAGDSQQNNWHAGA